MLHLAEETKLFDFLPIVNFRLISAHIVFLSVSNLISSNGRGGGGGGLEALPMIQRVKVRANFHRCKQKLVIIQGKSQVFTWLLLRFGSFL